MRGDINAKIVGYKESDRKIFIQIDAVPYDVLKKAIKKNYVPTLKKLINKKDFKLYRIFSELPSNLPAAQMKIMYGLKDKIKGFRWYSKKNKRHYNFKDPKTAQYWQNQAKYETEEELLEGGASYVNLYSGGAKRAILTFSESLDTNIEKRLNNSLIWKFIFINADLIINILFKCVHEFFVELFEYFKYKIKKLPQRNQIFFPYVRVGNNVFFREISTLGALIEMNENIKSIYLTFNGYDEVAHQRGPETKEAMKTLKGIDRSVRKIYKKAKKKGYDVFIFSDHGQTTSIPFKDMFQVSLKDFIKNEISKDIAKEVEINEYDTKDENKIVLITYFLKKLFKNLVQLRYKIFAKIIKKIFIKFKKNIKAEKRNLEEEILVTNSGPISHIYFKKFDFRMTDEDIKYYYKNLLKSLLYHQGIEFGLVKLKSGYLLEGKYGKIILDEEFEIISEEKKIFVNIELKQETILNSLKDISIGEDVGDILIFGAMLSKNKVINFEKQYGGHGGLGGMQNFPFLLTKKSINKKGIMVSDLYSILKD